MGVNFYSESIYLCAERVGEVLRERRWHLSSAESCTGGGLGHALTAISGSSEWYLGGVVSYSDDFKQRFLDVPAKLIGDFGAVSEEVVLAMASGMASQGEADTAIALTGIAGPDGGTLDKPVGLVWLACIDPQRGLRATQLNLEGSRDEIRQGAIHSVLKFFLLGL